MTYEEWLECINILKNKNDEDVKNKLLNEPLNENIQYILEPKIIELLKYKFGKSIEKIRTSLDETIYDANILDLELNDFKKELKFIMELVNIKELSDSNRKVIKEVVIEESDKVYEILIKEARISDPIGILEQVIKNNRIKWS